jgi:UDP-GlcNAc3NAcA epimerase
MGDRLRIWSVVGARPQIVKVAVLCHALKEEAYPISHRIIDTGQHYDHGMSGIFFDALDIGTPDFSLGVGSGSHGVQTGRMLAALDEVLRSGKPDIVLTYGDTNSTLAAALAAAKLAIPVAHVEAGLRSGVKSMPEEINRVLTDRVSSFLFCPSEIAAINLAKEGLTEGVLVTGDIMLDLLEWRREAVRSQVTDLLRRLGLQSGGYFLATIHRAHNIDNPKRRGDLLATLELLAESVLPVVLPIHPRLRDLLPSGRPSRGHLMIIEPLGYDQMLIVEEHAKAILTDSGGVQKEAYWLGVPCVTLREETEWVETVQTGWNVLAGATRSAIIDAVGRSEGPTERPLLYGDGRACRRVLARLVEGVAGS